MADDQYVPETMLCDNKECRHPLKDHGGEEVNILMLKTRSFPCLYFDKDNMTFAVCACRDFELPALGEHAPDTPDEPVHRIRIPGQALELVLWLSGRVTWDPV